MLNKIKKFWENHGFETLLSICVIFILLVSLYNIIVGKKGTYAPNKNTLTNLRKKFKNGSGGSKNLSTSPREVNSNGEWNDKKESRGEAECRRILQKLFGVPFISQRPDFLRNPVTGGTFNLELDCYNSDLKLAVEYNGIQHYKYTPYFHRNYDHFTNQKYRDDMKRRMCRENGVYLIEVPYTVKIPDIEEFIINAYKKIKLF